MMIMMYDDDDDDDDNDEDDDDDDYRIYVGHCNLFSSFNLKNQTPCTSLSLSLFQ